MYANVVHYTHTHIKGASMLLKLEHIIAATKLAPVTIEFALARNGYPNDRVDTASFMGMTPNGSFAYEISYPGIEEVETGRVYVYYDEQGKLLADY